MNSPSEGEEGEREEEEEEEEEKEKERKTFWPCGDILVRYFAMLFHTTWHVVSRKTLKDEQYVVIKAYKFTIFEILRDTFVLS